MTTTGWPFCVGRGRHNNPSEPFEELCRRVTGIVVESKHPYKKVRGTPRIQSVTGMDILKGARPFMEGCKQIPTSDMPMDSTNATGRAIYAISPESILSGRG